MELVVGVNPDEAGRDAVALGLSLARSLHLQPVLAYVHLPTMDYPSMGNVDAEWERYVTDAADAVLAECAAFAATAGAPEVRVLRGGHRSSGHGLAEMAESLGARLIVVGSAPGGSGGRIVQGSTANQLLHGSPVPVALAPHGFRRVAPERFGRVVVAYQGARGSIAAVQSAAALAAEMGASLLVVTVVLRMTRLIGSRLTGDPERQVLEVLVAQARSAQEEALAAVTGGVDASAEVVVGDTALQALARIEWRDDDLLLLGSAAGGPVRRVFLGDMTYKLLRAAPVPVLVLPRHP
ncbi:MAG: universal stress protein [Candidatus Nanopelagicales bacterium]